MAKITKAVNAIKSTIKSDLNYISAAKDLFGMRRGRGESFGTALKHTFSDAMNQASPQRQRRMVGYAAGGAAGAGALGAWGLSD